MQLRSDQRSQSRIAQGAGNNRPAISEFPLDKGLITLIYAVVKPPATAGVTGENFLASARQEVGRDDCNSPSWP